MVDETRAEAYVRTHLEPIGKEPVPIPESLLNPDQRYLNQLITDNRTETPHFEIQSVMQPFDGEKFIDAFRDARTAELTARTNSLSNTEFFKAHGKIAGTTARLAFRLSNERHNQLYQISNLNYRGNNGSLDYFSFIPEGILVIWNPFKDIHLSAFDPDADMVILSGDITSIAGVFVALHEAKHSNDVAKDPSGMKTYQKIMGDLAQPTEKDLAEVSESVKEMYPYRPKDLVTPEDLQHVLRFERSAHAFALRQMGYLITDKDILVALKDTIHHDPLQRNTNFFDSQEVLKP